MIVARLSEDASKRVLVIEAGTASPMNLLVRISGAILKLFQNPKFDWCWQTIAEVGCLGRRIFLCRGKLLGGSTCLNAQLAFRGSPKDYDSWGADGWTSKAMANEFKRIELRGGESMETCGMSVQLPNYQHELSRRFLKTCSAKVHPDLKRQLASFNDLSMLPCHPSPAGSSTLQDVAGLGVHKWPSNTGQPRVLPVPIPMCSVVLWTVVVFYWSCTQ